MTTYNRDIRVGNKPTTYRDPTNGNLGIDSTKGGSLANRTTKTPNYGSQPANNGNQIGGSNPRGNWGRDSWARSPKGTTTRTALDVTAKPVGKSERTTGDRVKVGLGNAARGLGNAAKGSVGRVTPGVGVNAKGDVEAGLRAGGAGVGISTKGEVSISVPGLSAIVDPKNLGNATVDIGFGALTIEQTRNGCTITVTVRRFGKIINQDIRQADNCEEPEPTPTPTPSPTPKPEPSPQPPPISTPAPRPPRPPKATYMEPGKYAVFSGRTPGDDREYWEAVMTYYWELSADELKYFPGLFHPIKVITIPGDTYFQETYYEGSYDRVFNTYEDVGNNTVVKNTFVITDFSIGHSGTFVDSNGIHKKVGTTYVNNLEPMQFIHLGGATWLLRWIYTNGTKINSIYSDPVKLWDHVENPALFYYDTVEDSDWWFLPLFPKSVVPKFKNNPRSLPKVNEQCDCELLEDIYEMLGGDTFYNNGLTIPNQIFTPGGSGNFKMKNYHEIFNIIFRTFSHRTPGEIEFTITDTNKGKEGDQSVTIKTLNAQGYYTMLLKSISNLGYENTDQMNILVRLGVITSQLMKVLVVANQNLKNILSFFDVPTKDFVEKVDIPFDLSLGGSLQKGFKSREDLQKELLKIVDKDTEEAIEGILDKFLNEWQMPTKVQKLRSTKEGGNFWYFLKQLR